MFTSVLSLVLISAYALLAGQKAHCVTSGSDALKYLRDVLQHNREQLDAADTDFKKLMTKPQKASFEQQVQKARVDRRELMLRQEFLDRLVFRLDARYLGGDLQQFLVTQLNDMAIVEASDPQGDTNLWKFMKSLASALQDQVERSENLAYFIEGYMKYSSVAKPIRPEDYLKARAYSNGQDSYAAHPITREFVGEVVERRLRALNINTLATKYNRN